MRIELVGGLGAGKTTLCKSFKKLGVTPIYEDISSNPFLPKCYKDPKAFRLPSQLHFALCKYDRLTDEMFGEWYVYDQATLTNNAYTNHLFRESMDDGSQWLLLKSFFEQTEKDLGLPDLLIHLKCDPYVQLDRIRGRGREFETVDIEFIVKLEAEIERLIPDYEKKGVEIIEFDVSEASFDDYDTFADYVVRERFGEEANNPVTKRMAIKDSFGMR